MQTKLNHVINEVIETTFTTNEELLEAAKALKVWANEIEDNLTPMAFGDPAEDHLHQ